MAKDLIFLYLCVYFCTTDIGKVKFDLVWSDDGSVIGSKYNHLNLGLFY